MANVSINKKLPVCPLSLDFGYAFSSVGDVGLIPGSGRSPGMATHSSILAWEIPWAEEPSGLHTVHGVAKNQTQLSNERNACGINLVPPLETEHKPSVVKAWGVLTPGPPGNSTKLCPSIRPINMTLVLQACVYIYHSYWSLGKECLGAFWHGPQMF